MDVQAITQIISTVGFPIAACIGLGWFVYHFVNKVTNDSTAREQLLMQHLEEQNNVLTEISKNMDKMSTTLDNMNQRLSIVEMKVETKVQGN